MQEQPSYYAIIPANVRYADIPANAKLLYGEITALTHQTGECWASNSYFAELYRVSKETISRWVSKLVKNGFIKVIVYRDGNTKQIQKRVITICTPPIDKNVNTSPQNNQYPIDKNVKENTTRVNNTRIEKLYKKKDAENEQHKFQEDRYFQDDWKAEAEKYNFTEQQLKDICEDFINYYTQDKKGSATRTTKRGWDGRWRTFLKNEYTGFGKYPNGKPSYNNVSGHAGMANAFASVIAKRRNGNEVS